MREYRGSRWEIKEYAERLEKPEFFEEN